ncbi:MAG: hypothetical protein P9M08_00335 [Candidatus Erginobacter occultus]|nr:hypothetical protein [Candidatus Erginobacter occultus]
MVAAALWSLLFPGIRSVSAGVSLSLQEGPLRFYSGSSAELTIELFGLPPEGEPSAVWKLMLGAAAVGEGETRGERGEEGTAAVRARLDFPAVSRPVEVAWAVKIFAGGRPAAEEFFLFRVYPRDLAARLRAALAGKKPGVYDPRGKLFGLLDSAGVEYTAIHTPFGLRAFRGETLLVGPRAFSSPRESLFTLLEDSGVRGVLILDQAVFPGDLPCPVEPGDPISTPGGRSVAVASGHPVLDGLEGEDLPRTGPGVRPLKKPGRGRYRSLIDPAPLRPDSGGFLSLVLECLPGGRRLIFCQIPLLGAVGRDPAADLLLANLVDLLFLPLEEPDPVFVIGGAGREERDFCRAMGLPGPRLSRPPGPYRQAIVFAGPGTVESLAGREDELVSSLGEMIESGGRLLLIGLDPETLPFWRPLLPEGLELAEYQPGAVSPPEDPLFRGISATDWEGCLRAASDYSIYQTTGEGIHPVAPLVGKADRGRGAVVICQFPFHRLLGEPASAASAAQFITNLGLAREPGPAGDKEAGR